MFTWHAACHLSCLCLCQPPALPTHLPTLAHTAHTLPALLLSGRQVVCVLCACCAELLLDQSSPAQSDLVRIRPTTSNTAPRPASQQLLCRPDLRLPVHLDTLLIFLTGFCGDGTFPKPIHAPFRPILVPSPRKCYFVLLCWRSGGWNASAFSHARPLPSLDDLLNPLNISPHPPTHPPLALFPGLVS